MKQMSLSEVCKHYGFTRRVIQGYEKEGLIKHIGKNKYGHLMYEQEEVKKVAYIRYLQRNGLTLKEISLYVKDNPKTFISKALLQKSNNVLKSEIKRLNELIKKNEMILKLCSKENEDEILKIIMEVIKDEEINKKDI